MKKRAMTSEQARFVRQRGHDDAKEFALAIWLTTDYQNNLRAKKDVVDPSGDTHSVKSGVKKWQIFLYGLDRFWSDDTFSTMNGVGGLLTDCINSFPPTFASYKRDKMASKERLRKPMRALANVLQDKKVLRAFLNRSIFSTGEVDYLTIKDCGIFLVFARNDVIKVLGDNLEVCNSTAHLVGQVSDLKVLFRYQGINLGEIEIRTDSLVHYREAKFSMAKPKVVALLLEKVPLTRSFNPIVWVYGNACKTFGRWEQ